MVIEYKPGKWKFRHECSHGHHVEGPFDSKIEANKALNEHKEKCGD